ncbi:MAG: PAS domain-containing protein [Proteobacteria bacterium]|nr:PAS domain-containing protein [Pseudomonadota bacterium]
MSAAETAVAASPRDLVPDGHESEIESLYGRVPVGLALIDRELRYRRCNERLAEMHGLPAAAHLGRTLGEVLPHLAAEIGPLLRRVLDSGEALVDVVVRGETAARPGEVRVWSGDYCPVRGGDGVVTGVQVVVREITEARRAAEELARRAALLDLATDAIMVRDADGTIRYWSRGSEVLYGYPAAVAVGRRAQELLATRWPVAREDVHRILATTGEWSGELVQRTAAGGELVMLTRLRYAAAAPGAPPEVLESGTDITKRKADERRLQDAFDAAERASAAKTDFLAMMSHELRTPLQAITTAIELLAPDPERRGTRPEYRHIAFASQSMARLVDDLLDMARLDRARLPLERRTVNLRQLLERVLDPFAARAAAKGLAFEVGVDPAVPEALWTDPVRFGQVLANVAGNAVKFTAEGGVRVAVGLGDSAAELRVAVADTGIGIPPERHAAIFEPFTQASPEQRERYGGLGLGLAIAAELTRSMGGRIALDSRIGAGSRFDLRFPVEHAP